MRGLAAVLALLAFWFAPGSSAAQTPLPAEMPAQCRVPRAIYIDDNPLPRAAQKLAKHGRLKIAAIGSSSTMGVGASAPEAAWPARLEADLRRRLPGAEITVENYGKLRDVAGNMVKRMKADILASKPDLVIWETGTAEAVRNLGVEQFAAALEEGVDQIAAAGAETILMTPQYSRETARLIGYQPYLDAMNSVAQRRDVLLFPRFDVMRHLVESGQLLLEGLSPAEAAATADRLYDCIARQTARVLLRAMSGDPAR
jgi:lysophospholipase L1-like esterase